MRNGFGEIDNGLSALLIHVEKKDVEKEDNFLQAMIKSLHNLHSKEKSIFFKATKGSSINDVTHANLDNFDPL